MRLEPRRIGKLQERLVHERGRTHRRVPVVTGLFIAACLLTFAYEVALLLGGQAEFSAWMGRHALVPARVLAAPEDHRQWLTVGSAMFLHGGAAHVLGNCWFLWVFGNNVEDRLGSVGFVFFYLFCGLVAALAQIAVDPGSTVPMIGASGAISGVLGAYLVFFPKAWVVSLVPWIVPILPIPAVVFLVLWFFIQAYSGVGMLMSGPASGGGVAWFAHAGGFLAGAIVALMLPRRARR